MNYKKAQGLKNKGLWSLIAENKFEEGKSFRSSVGGAISDKFKAKMTRTKEKFDPLNILSSIVGKKNIFGKVITTAAGRAFGRSEADIGYFGGYRRKGENRKDPRRTTIGPGPIKALRIGDSTADILAKTYNFMEKTHEQEIKRYELEKSFREEQMQEDERRHKKLIDELLKSNSKKNVAEVSEIDTGNTWIDKMLDGIKAALGFVLNPIKKLFGVMGSILGKVLTLFGSFAQKLGEAILGAIINNIGGIFELLIDPIKKLIGITLQSVLSAMATSTNLLTKGVQFLSGGVMGNILAAGFAAIAGVATFRKINEYKQGLNEGEESVRIDNEISDMESKYQSPSGETFPIEDINAMNKEIEKLKKERVESAKKYQKEILDPAMEAQGWKRVFSMDGDINPKYMKDGEEASELDKQLAISTPEMISFITKKAKSINPFNIYNKNIKPKIENSDEYKDFKKMEQYFEDKLKYFNLESPKELENFEPNVIINNSTNSIGSPQETQDTTPISLRDSNLSYVNRMNYIAA